MSNHLEAIGSWLESLGLQRIAVGRSSVKVACPFHDDSGASLSFFGSKYKCFSSRCGVEGHLAGFAEILGQRLPDWVATAAAEAYRPPPTLPEIPRYRLAAYQTPYARMQARGIPDKETDAWEIRWDHRKNAMLIPVADHEDRLIGCAWRYDKGKLRYQTMKGLPRDRTLYGLGRYLRRRPEGVAHVYVVEGYADVWKCWVAGIPAVSCFGNFMTRGQVELLTSLDIFRVTVMFDNDAAGYEGAARTLRLGWKSLDLDFAMDYGGDKPKDPGEADVEFLQALAQRRKDRP